MASLEAVVWSCSVKKAALKTSQNSLFWSLFLTQLQAESACNFIKKRLQCKCFPVNFTKFLKTPISRAPAKHHFCILNTTLQQTTLQKLLPNIVKQ